MIVSTPKYLHHIYIYIYINTTLQTQGKKHHTVSGNFVQGYIVLVGHVPKEGEDHKAREETG